ncbi:snRNA-activating protein complex subunit 3-like isoform X1 [Homalodisca vitripennis]|uniref:snRNA-activating protein complex subunit 3-like isoform X1 n=2 Tax=Homalodisca vitripennis TaxID=197043 RepID=UPI001EECEE58|nr:snRNA-activating protein complex subunit 3-like isoform X1 [Homalodisca vitripennis]
MEEIYMKGFVGRRAWCSEKVHLKSYFEKYSDTLCEVANKRISEIDILQQFVPQSNQLSQEELFKLIDIMTGEQLTTLLDEDVLKKKIISSKKNTKPSTSSVADEANPSSSFSKGSYQWQRQDRLRSDKFQVVRREVVLDATEKVGPKNLLPNRDFMVSFRIHDPFSHTVGDNSRPGSCSQQINVLGQQFLTALKDKIVCESDFQDTRGDVSEQPDAPVTLRARELYESSMFYFDNTFYIDTRNNENVDYSKTIKEWGTKRGILFGGTKQMERTLVEDLEIRFGYPYLYLHQGCCEHVVIINDARLLTPKDSLFGFDYPLMTKVSHKNLIHCMTCSRFPAKWIVRGSDRLAHDPTYQCKTCFKLLHYKNGKKIGKFTAYQYWQRSTIL